MANSTLDMFRLDGSVAIITGAAGLLGEQEAIALGDFGSRLVLVDRKADACAALAARLSAEKGIEAIGMACDVTQRTSWQEVLAATISKFGKVDILVNNAAFTTESRSPNYGFPFPEFPLEDWNAILGVNLTGSFLGCQVVGAQMLQLGAGSIINIASMYGVVSPPHRMYPGTGIVQPVAYSVSKAGVVALTRYLATLWADRGVRVNSITPGGVFNGHPAAFTDRYANLSPIGRMAQPDEMRGAFAYLASSASRYCTGHNLVVDGGWTVW
jgi:NAD(P)-dependent dehydrogenase (short-subunit alcohol dehydrogenase family)